MCIWMDATRNKVGIYRNGTLAQEKSFNFDPIPGGGSFMIGQEQDTIGGGFDTNQALW